MLGVADQALALGIDDPVEQFERYLAEQDGELITDFADVDGRVASPNGQTDCAKHRRGQRSAQPTRLWHPYMDANREMRSSTWGALKGSISRWGQTIDFKIFEAELP